MQFTTQFARFVVVGLLSNLILYLFYLLFTGLGLGHKLAMTIMYMIGVTQTFIFNRNWTFGHKGHIPQSFMSYISIYVFGYLLNLSGLYFFVDKLGFSHEWVQGVLVFLIALLLFLLLKTFAFSESVTGDDS